MQNFVKYLLGIALISISGCATTMHQERGSSVATTLESHIPVKPFPSTPQGYIAGKAIVGPFFSIEDAVSSGVREAIHNLVESYLSTEVTIQAISLSEYTGYGGTRRYHTSLTIGKKKAKVLKFDLYQCAPFYLPNDRYGAQIMVICKEEDIKSVETESEIIKHCSTSPDTKDAYKMAIKLLKAVSKWLGVPYSWGGDSKFDIDCSHFVYQVYQSIGVGLPYPNTQNQIKSFINKGHYIKYLNKRRFGDLIYFGYLTGNGGFKSNHVVLYLGDNHIAHACSDKGVIVERFSDLLAWFQDDPKCQPLFIARPYKGFKQITAREQVKIHEYITSHFLEEINVANTESQDRNCTDEVAITLAREGQNRRLTLSEIKTLSPKQLRLLRNAFFAFHNRPFHTQWIQRFFEENLPGYTPNPDKWNTVFSSLERRNVEFIKSYEKKMGYVK